MGVTPQEFRLVLGHLASGVAIVTARDADGAPRGLTATAVTSVSLIPPMVLVCLGTESDTHEAISHSGVFAVSFLGSGDRALADVFASDSESKFAGVAPWTDDTGVPVLECAIAWCRVTVVHEVPAGDHTVFIGRVENAGVGESTDPAPLLHYRGRYSELEPGP